MPDVLPSSNICLYLDVTNSHNPRGTGISHLHGAKISSFVCCEEVSVRGDVVECYNIYHPLNILGCCMQTCLFLDETDDYISWENY